MAAHHEFDRRQALLRRAMRRKRVQAMLVTHLPNVRYLCGFTGSSGVLFVGEEQSWFFTDGRYSEQSRKEVRAAEVRIEKAPFRSAIAGFRNGQCAKVGYEGQHLSVAQFRDLQSHAGRRMRLQDAGMLVEELRMVKDAEEIQRIRAAAHLAVELWAQVRPKIRAGIAETTIAAEIEYAARMAGADAMSFETIVAGGTRSALPHGRASKAPLTAGGFVILDFGVILAGYCSDMTRTVHLGEPDARARKMYAAVLKAQLAAVDAVRPGASAASVDQAARRMLEAEGFGQFFTHSTGHGLGLEIHEPPRLAKGQRKTLRPGMVITIEPGIYIAGEGGVRIEDMVLVTERGSEVLTSASKELAVV